MKKLTYLFVMIIFLASILVLNGMGVFAYEKAILSAEMEKNSMLNLSIKYDSLLSNLKSAARFYIITNDEKNKTEFYLLHNEYLNKDNISLKYHTFTEYQASKELKNIVADKGFDLSAQVESLGFTQSERDSYNNFLNYYNQLIGELSDAINTRDMGIINSSHYFDLNEFQSYYMTSLCKSYIDRTNIKEDLLLKYQKIFALTLIFLLLLLLVIASLTFNAILKENRYNSYFRQLYNTVVENINVGICIMDKDYYFEYMNSMYKEVMCVTSENVIGKSLSDIFNQNIVETIEEYTGFGRKETGEVDIMIENKRKHIAYNHFAIKDENCSSKYVHLIQDYTDTKNMQSQLIKQLKEIEFYSHAKDNFIANISHEIKTPINAVLGMVHFLKNTKLSEDQKNLVGKIETSSDILLTIINDVLDLSKIKNDNLSLYPSDFVLAQVLENVEDMFSNQLVSKDLKWLSDYEFNKNLSIHLDKTRFVQVLINLLTNAIKFTDKGYVKLSIEVLFESNEHVNLQFCIEDTGIGIAEKDISKLFLAFEQLDNNLTKLHQGTGLGLYISKNIIDSMGGRMWVKSVKGEGSKFYFIIHAEKAFNHAVLDNAVSVIKSMPFDGNGEKALIVEDTEINSEVAVKLLNDVNIACDTATDGLEAIKMCINKQPDYYKIILMDIHMPNMDGYTAAYKLKKELGIKSPIVAITASDINEQIKEDHKDTIDGFILKPFKVSAFYKILSTYFINTEAAVTNKPITESLEGVEIDSVKDGGLEIIQDMIVTSDPFAGRAEAIKNIGGMESIYKKHVEKFKVNYVNSALDIKRLLGEKNYDEANRLAHSIKGLGGTLGMLNVQNTAAALEKGILKGEGYDLSTELEAFDCALKAVTQPQSQG